MPADLPVLIIDGASFDDFTGFARAFSRHLDSYVWNGNLDAFNDLLRGGFGTPEQGFVLRWTQSERSRVVLGWEATTTWYEQHLQTCHPENVGRLQTALEEARRKEGTTLFDWIVEIIRHHGPGGHEAEGNVHLELT